ncbi:MAG: hypothetical protein ACE15C_05170 [Phycisphaerae bacterium]
MNGTAKLLLFGAGAGALLILAMASAPARGADMNAPANVEVIVKDAGGKPIDKATVKLTLSAPNQDDNDEPPPLMANTDVVGKARLEVKRPKDQPADSIGWGANIRVEKDGYIAARAYLGLFPGADVEHAATLDRASTTIIHLRGPGGAAVSGASLSLYCLEGSDNSIGLWQVEGRRTDVKGDYRWVHSALKKSRLSVGSKSFAFADAPEVTINLKADELPPIVPPRRLEGRLVDAQGRPAVGWFVASDCTVGGWIMWGGLTMSSSLDYTARRFEAVGEDGSFTIDPADEEFFLISPDGAAFARRLNPAAWPEGPRRITLSIPAIRRMHKGRVVDEAGRPLAGVPIVASEVMLPHGRLRLSVATAGRDRTVPLHRARTASGALVRPVVTDKDGAYALPIYAGGRISYQAICGGGEIHGDPAMNAAITMKAARGRIMGPYKRITVAVTDSAGKRLDDVRVNPRQPQGPDAPIICAYQDKAGWSVFAPAPLFVVPVEITGRAWTVLAADLDVQGERDQAVKVTMPEANRLKPLKGRVLDPDGKAVVGATISLLRVPEQNSSYGLLGGLRYLGVTATTDEDGRFAIPAAPDSCLVNVSRHSEDDYRNTLPGWCEAPKTTAGERDIAIKLARGGSIRILLPKALGRAPDLSLRVPKEERGAYVYWFDPAGRDSEMIPPLVFNAEDKTMTAGAIRPGKYELGPPENMGWLGWRARPAAADADLPIEGPWQIEPTAVRIEAGKETVVDLSGRAVPGADVKRAWMGLKVVGGKDKKPVSGAAVMVYATLDGGDETLARCVRELGSNSLQVRSAADDALRKAGNRGAGAILAGVDLGDLEARARAEDILKSINGPAPNRPEPTVRLAAADLSDEGGSLRFRGQVGRKYIAVARVEGKWIGLSSFICRENGQATVYMLPARTLTVRLKPLPPPPTTDPATGLPILSAKSEDPRCVDLCLEGLRCDEAAALTDALDITRFSPNLAIALKRLATAGRDGPDAGTFIVEDLPAGLAVRLVARRDEATVLEDKAVKVPADGPAECTLDAPLPN